MKSTREIEPQQEDTQKGRFLTFNLGEEVYGIEIKYVTEIVKMQDITTIPEVPKFVKGIINLRGKIIPVIDVRLKFNKKAVKADKRTCIIVVELEEMNVGLIVDNVLEVATINEEDMSQPPKDKTGFTNRFIQNIGKLNENVVLLLDCTKMLSCENLEKLDEIELKE